MGGWTASGSGLVSRGPDSRPRPTNGRDFGEDRARGLSEGLPGSHCGRWICLRFAGHAYRAHDPRWSFQPLSGIGAAIRGGRFNPINLPALYLALDPLTALKETNQGLVAKFNPCVLCTYEIDCEDILDLSAETTRNLEEIPYGDLAAPWLFLISAGQEPPQWPVVRRLRGRSVAGIIVPSFAPGATAADRNLVLWRWSPDLPHKVEVFDPSGRLPKNQLSWD
jgi:RES domain-containing protein